MKTHHSDSTEPCQEPQSLQTQIGTVQQKEHDQTQKLLELQLRERIKELDCLYKLTKLIERNEDSLDKILQGTADLLPTSWQYPEISCARIRYREQVFQSANFKSTRWRQNAPISINDNQEGLVEVHYLKKKPRLDEGPFLKEERQLIDAVSNRIAKAAERISTQRQLQVERQALRDANAALHDSLVQSQREKKMVGVSIQAKIDKIITPILYALQVESNSRQLEYLNLLKKNLEDIITPFVEGNQKVMGKLSPVELQVANMIKHGLSTKEIAGMRGTSPATINRHRESIRRKLGITNHKVNLTSYLNNIVDVQKTNL